MSWQAVAEKDFRDAIRSRLLLALTVLFVLFSGGAAYFAAQIRPPPQVQFGGELTTVALISGLLGPVSVFIPVVAIAAAYRAVAGERQSGSLKFLLSLPNSRLDVLVGKFLGRAGVVSGALLAGFGVGLFVVASLAEQFSAPEYLAFVVVSLLLAFVFVSVAVGVSAFTTSTSRAAYGAFGIFILFQFLWSVLVSGFVYAANGFEFPGPEEEFPEWLRTAAEFLTIIDPTAAYQQGVLWVARRLAENADAGAQGATDGPFYVQDWFGFVVLLFWIGLPLLVGYWRFERADL
jgi:ABC-2 type transport system permease protein